MINDNKYCINGVVEAIKGYIASINKYLFKDVPSIVVDNVHVTYPSMDNMTDFISKNETCQAVIRIKYHTVSGEVENKAKTADIYLPLLIDGIYVIEGKCRLPLNYIVNDPECAIYENKIILNSSLYISRVNGLKVALDDNNKSFEKVDYETIDPELLRLTDHAAKKLSILFDLDTIPAYITESIVKQIISKWKTSMRDNVLNKKIMTPEMALVRNLEINRKSIIDGIRGKYYHSVRYKKHDSTGTLYLKSVQNAIDKFFRGTDQYFTGIQNPTNANPLIFESMKSKVIFETNSDNTSKLVPYSKYDLSFYGLVDPAATPDNGNSSRVNELTRSVVIRNGETYIKALDKEFDEVEVKYIDYICSRVLVSAEVDYDFKELVNDNPIKKCKYKFKEIESEEWDYIEMSPDYRLCLSSAQLPMVNLSDSVRVGMGTKMVNQAITVIGAEDRRVSSGNEALYENPLIIKFDEPMGIVKEVEAGIISIQLPDGTMTHKTIPAAIRGNNGVNITFESVVSEGDKIYIGDTLIKPTTLNEDHKIRLGVNARVAMMTYRGYNFEDGFIVSESFAEKMTHVTVEDVKIEITPDIILEGFKDVGDRIDSSMVLMSGKQRRSFKGDSKEFLNDIGSNKKYYNDWRERCPLNVDEGMIFDMKVVKGDVVSRSEETTYLLEEGRGRQTDRNHWDLGIDYESDAFADLNLQYIHDFKATKGSSYTIVYRLIIKHKLRTHDKISNGWGSKGIVGLILPDEKMPYDEHGNPVEVLMNPDAVLSRKNIPQTMELEINQLMDVVFKIQSKLISEGKFDEARANFKKYKMANYYKMTDEELVAYHENNKAYQYITGSYSKIGPKELTQWKDELGISAGIYLWDGITHKKIRNPIMVSDMYLMKLYFLADAVAKVTSEKIPGVHTLVMGKGAITKRGSKHGNMEMDAIIANGIMDYAKKMKSSNGDSAAWMLANVILTGMIMKPGKDYESKD